MLSSVCPQLGFAAMCCCIWYMSGCVWDIVCICCKVSLSRLGFWVRATSSVLFVFCSVVCICVGVIALLVSAVVYSSGWFVKIFCRVAVFIDGFFSRFCAIVLFGMSASEFRSSVFVLLFCASQPASFMSPLFKLANVSRCRTVDLVVSVVARLSSSCPGSSSMLFTVSARFGFKTLCW